MDNKELRTELCIFTCHSQNIGIGTPKEYVEIAKDHGIKALAITDLYSTEGYREFQKECLDNDVFPIFGITIYPGSFEIIVIAKNAKGIATINKICSLPDDLIDYHALKQFGEDVIFIAITNNKEAQEFALKHFDYVGIDASEPFEISESFMTKEHQDKLVVLSCAHYPSKEDKIVFDIMQTNEYETIKALKTTSELLSKFDRRFVIDNPNRIRDSIDYGDYGLEDKPVSLNYISAEDFRSLVNEEAKKRLGTLKEDEEKRLHDELEGVISYGYHDMFYVAHKVAEFYKGRFMVKGGVSNSLLSYVLGISRINPLKWNLHHSIFLGYDYSRVPYFHFDVRWEDKNNLKAYQYLDTLLGHGKVLKTYNSLKYSEEDIASLLTSYAFNYGGLRYKKDAKEAKIFKLLDSTKGQIEVGHRYVFVPDIEEIYKYTSIEENEEGVILTDNNFNESMPFLPNLAITNSDLVDEIEEIFDYMDEVLEKNFFDLPIDDDKVLSLFESDKALKKKRHIMDNPSPFIGIKGLDSPMASKIIEASKPKTPEDLVKVLGLLHGTNVWLGNAEELFANGYHLEDVIANRDDILDILVNRYKATEKDAFLIMESVRKGRGIKPAHEELLNNLSVDQYLIDSMKKIKYAFPRSHAISFAVAYLMMAYVKVYHKDIFYYAVKEKYRASLDINSDQMEKMKNSELKRIYESKSKSKEKEFAAILLEERERK